VDGFVFQLYKRPDHPDFRLVGDEVRFW
jgi:hypothetical protein